MVFDVSVAMTWVLFLALFPIAFYWLRRSWRIWIRRDFAEVALRRGEPPEDPESFATYAALINLVGGTVIVVVIIGVTVGILHYDSWTAVAGSTIWMKFVFDFILSRHAHPIVPKLKRHRSDGR